MTAVTPGRTGNQFNLVAQARRQPGSTFKTFVLTAAVEQGMNPDSTYYTSAPFHYQPDPYTPRRGTSRPTTTPTRARSRVTSATLASDNTVYAQLTLDVGPEDVAEMAHRLGVRAARSTLVPSMGLGAIAVSPLEHGLRLRDARGGRDLLEADGDPQGRARQRQGRHRRRLGQAAAQAGDPRRRRLRGDEDPRGEHARGHGHRRLLRPARRPARPARPTTTPTRGSRGYTPQLEATVWVGYPQGEIPMDERPWHLRLRRHVPGHDLEAVHGVRARRTRLRSTGDSPWTPSSGGPSHRASTRRASRPHRPRTTHRRRRPRERRPRRLRPRTRLRLRPSAPRPRSRRLRRRPWLRRRRRDPPPPPPPE